MWIVNETWVISLPVSDTFPNQHSRLRFSKTPMPTFQVRLWFFLIDTFNIEFPLHHFLAVDGWTTGSSPILTQEPNKNHVTKTKTWNLMGWFHSKNAGIFPSKTCQSNPFQMLGSVFVGSFSLMFLFFWDEKNITVWGLTQTCRPPPVVGSCGKSLIFTSGLSRDFRGGKVCRKISVSRGTRFHLWDGPRIQL